MDGNTSRKPRTLTKTRNNKRLQEQNGGGHTETEDEECDVEAWNTLSKSFKQAQTVLDKNRHLIQQANENHQSRIPDNISKNVALIQEINGNISKVVSIYSDLSVNFTNVVSQRKQMKNGHAESMGS